MPTGRSEGKLPGTVFSARQVRLLKIAVIVMGALLVAGFAAVLSSLVYQASQLGDSGGKAKDDIAVRGELAIGSGTEVVGLALDGNRLALHLRGEEGAEIAIVDLQSGKIVAASS